jgi:hypothetical protein
MMHGHSKQVLPPERSTLERLGDYPKYNENTWREKALFSL